MSDTTAGSGARESAVDRTRSQITALIDELALRPGERLPTEAALTDRLKTSRSTVREAFRQLEQSGIVVAVQGQGRFLSASGGLRVERPVTKYESITEVLTARGYRVTSAVLSVSEAEADAEAAAALEVEVGTRVIRLVRIRFGDDRPLVVSENIVPRELLPGPIEHRDWGGSLTAALAAHGEYVQTALATLSAVELPADWEAQFNLSGMGPWLLVTEVGLSISGRRVLHAKDYHRGSEISFTVLRQR
ncbi:GntR family transcriptional regulator [Leucobacter sp. L43]|uniref:GntR family transcriptional regulator n=1 Tax=Leucobacter sp. L43 TaxID=2798040 RepID=UPI001F371EDD|nr:GntR family transcriptional regulator [Leucobacter sp. L43]